MISSASLIQAIALLLGASDRVDDELLGVVDVEPFHDRYPFSLFEILVVLKEMRDLLAHDRRQVAVARNARVEGIERIDRNGQDLFIPARLVLHHQRADRTATNDRAGATSTWLITRTSQGSPSADSVCGM